MCDPLFVDYGVNEPGKCVRAEAGRLFLHCQHLPSEMRLEMPQSAHHSHLRVLQALAGTSMWSQLLHRRVVSALPVEMPPHIKSNLFLLSPVVSRQVTNGARDTFSLVFSGTDKGVRAEEASLWSCL